MRKVLIGLCVLLLIIFQGSILYCQETSSNTGSVNMLNQAVIQSLEMKLGSSSYQELIPDEWDIITPHPSENNVGRSTEPRVIAPLPDEKEAVILTSYTVPDAWDIVYDEHQYRFKRFYLQYSLGVEINEWIRQEINTLRGTLQIEYYIADSEGLAQYLYRWLLSNNPRPTQIFYQGRVVYDVIADDMQDQNRLLSMLNISLFQKIKLNCSDIPPMFVIQDAGTYPESTVYQFENALGIPLHQVYFEQFYNTAEQYYVTVSYFLPENSQHAPSLAEELRIDYPTQTVEMVSDVLVLFTF